MRLLGFRYFVSLLIIGFGNDAVGGIPCITHSGSNQREVPLEANSFPTSPPIELLSFTVFVLQNRTVKILWKTRTETNNDYFTIERSRNATQWEELTQMKGAGNSQELLRYENTDQKAFLGTSYYRLKQTDFNGESSYSQIMELYIDPGKVMPLTVYPNPTKGLLTIEGAPDELDEFSLFNQRGTEVSDRVRIIDRSDFRISLDVSKLPKGVYLLKTENETVKVERQ